jgi:hypothetical protein
MINILNWPIVRDCLINFLGISYVAKLNAKIAKSLGFFEKISGQLVKCQCHINCHEKRHLYLSVII